MLSSLFTRRTVARSTRANAGLRPSAEMLDARILPSATATLSRGVLTVKGDVAAANNLTFETINGGNGVRVTGTGGTLLNEDLTELDFAGVTSIKVITGATSDSITIRAFDSLTVKNVTLSLGNGNNTVSISDAVIEGKLAITTGNGEDTIRVASIASFGTSTSVTTLNGPVTINTGSGADSIIIRCDTAFDSSTAFITLNGPLTINTGNGDDRVVFESFAAFDQAASTLTLNGIVKVTTGNDNDLIDVVADGGFDSAFADFDVNNHFTINSGSGDDGISVRTADFLGGHGDLDFSRNLTIAAGNDDDEVWIGSSSSDIAIGGILRVTTGSGIDDLTVERVQQTSSVGSNSFSMGNDLDTVRIRASVFAAATSTNLGSGNNNVLEISQAGFQGNASLISQGREDVLRIENTSSPYIGGTTFSGKVTVSAGPSASLLIGFDNSSPLTTFLGSVTLTGKSPFGTATFIDGRVVFTIPPVVKKFQLA
ncbi:hypothetical protein Pan44_22490 [Caulifigura coniformis]|uniref:Uncharacterized protein n=1 Tax=Caulifigura coniformis TaxID=2527983 RepID=A0A517SDL9_9PLAN|nr:hypothetical protein [Caulifigura coniformis]QDT54222.1 hypothetical protein Pan44_22490 [Caulifigura coniformis]